MVKSGTTATPIEPNPDRRKAYDGHPLMMRGGLCEEEAGEMMDADRMPFRLRAHGHPETNVLPRGGKAGER